LEFRRVLFRSSQVDQKACALWTQSVPRYRVTRVNQSNAGSELGLEELPLPEHPSDARVCVDEKDCTGVTVATTRGSSETIVLPTSCINDGHGAKRCLV